MFNILISANPTAWETDDVMRMELDRFKEYSDGPEAKSISPDHFGLVSLEGIPTLLMYERGTESVNADIVRYGYLHDINPAGKMLEFQFDERGRFQRAVVDEFSDRLGLGRFEQNRTHWAVKSGDIPDGMRAKLLPLQTASMLPTSPRIAPFISYAHEDGDAARRLFANLKKVGATPWLDSENLLGGQDWDLTIRDAIRSSTHVLALISKNSVNKKGFVQKELRHALEILDEFPPNQIFVIPIRLDESMPVHERLRRLHQIDLFPDYPLGFERILTSLGIASVPPKTASLEAYERVASFARKAGGLELKEDQARRWGDRWLRRYDFELFSTFERIFRFAKAPTGLALHARAAALWAEEWLATSLHAKFGEFLKAFEIARNSRGMSINEAKHWAMARVAQ
ncbi:MAG TPA: toll/interleukin-1 receptor domain-containing protein [Chthoniobacterales bacterium]|nr:toll/interleukin-1 receptor domain-containing protein [Chthoniobacterales bacterium]